MGGTPHGGDRGAFSAGVAAAGNTCSLVDLRLGAGPTGLRVQLVL